MIDPTKYHYTQWDGANKPLLPTVRICDPCQNETSDSSNRCPTIPTLQGAVPDCGHHVHAVDNHSNTLENVP
jgi:hypothetical protein